MDLMNQVSEIIYKELSQYSDEGRYRISLSWCEGIFSMVRELCEERDLASLAKLYEVIGVFEMNLHTRSEAFFYTVPFTCSSCYYYASGDRELAYYTAKRNYIHFRKKYEEVYQKYGKYSLEELQEEDQSDRNSKSGSVVGMKIQPFSECGLYQEVLADICMFFDQSKAKEYYAKAMETYRIVTEIDQSYLFYMTHAYSYDVPQEHYYSALKLCFDIDLSIIEDKNCIERVQMKQKLFEMIDLE